MTTHQHRPRGALKLPKDPAPYSKAARVSALALQANAAAFPGSAPVVTKLLADLDALDAADAAIKTGPHGSADARDLKWEVVKLDMEQVEALVQKAIDANPAAAASLAAQAGLHLHEVPTHGPHGFEAAQGGASGSVKVTVPSAGAGAYNYQCSLDGGKTWPIMLTSDLAHATFTGLPVGTTALFQWRHTLHGVTGDWSQSISFVVR